MRLLFLPVLTAAIVIGGATAALPEVVVTATITNQILIAPLAPQPPKMK